MARYEAKAPWMPDKGGPVANSIRSPFRRLAFMAEFVEGVERLRQMAGEASRCVALMSNRGCLRSPW